TTAGTEEDALDRRTRNPQTIRDLLVRKALELTHHEGLVLRRRQARERLLERLHVLALRDGAVHAVAVLSKAALILSAEVVRVERDLVGPVQPAKVVDAGVPGDLVDPGLEGDLSVGGAKTSECGDEGFLDDVLGAAGITDDRAHVGSDPVSIA